MPILAAYIQNDGKDICKNLKENGGVVRIVRVSLVP